MIPRKPKIKPSNPSNKFVDFFKDVDGSLSIKRLLALFFSLLAGMVIICNLFWGMLLATALIDLLEYLIIALVLGITSEKFSKRGITSVEANDEVMLKQEQIKTK